MAKILTLGEEVSRVNNIIIINNNKRTIRFKCILTCEEK